MGVVLAITSALGFGMSDFVAGLLSRRSAAVAVAAFAQTAATLVVLSLAPFVEAPDLTGGALAWGALSGVGSGLGTAFLYRGLGAGRMSVVAPVSAVGAAVLPVLVGLAMGERPSWLAASGIVIAVPAIWLVSTSSEPPREAASAQPSRLAAGVVDGLLAGAGFALLFIALDRVPEGTGLWPVGLGQAVSIVAVLCLAIPGRTSLRLHARGIGGAAVVGVLGAAGTLLYMFATRQQLLAIAAVLTSLYPAVTILLARLLLREYITPPQILGLGCAAAAVSLIAWG